MIVDLSETALIILEDFVKYGRLYPDEMASVMYYDEQGFRIRLARLAEDIEKAEEGKADDNN